MALNEMAPDAELSALRVLLVDNNARRRDVMESMLTSPAVGAVVVAAVADHEAAVEAGRSESPDVVLLEIQLPVVAGLHLLGELRREVPDLPVVVCSFHADTETKARVIAQGASGYIDKPVGTRDLRMLLRRAASEPPAGASTQPASQAR